MRKVIGIGETMLDIIFKDGRPIEAVPGGSTFNSIISLGRSGVAAAFVSETGNDRVGEYVIKFLRDNGVDASKVNTVPEGKSPVSLAFLNDRNEADYIFYRDTPHGRPDYEFPDIQPDDIVIFGSFYAVNPQTRPQVAALLEHARSHGAIIYYDVNFRPSHRDDVMRATPNLIENLEYADIVRGSRDDFRVLYKIDDPDKVYKSEISFYSKKFIYTDGAQPTVVFADGGLRREYPVKPMQTVSTIGAGDNFNAGIIFGLLKCRIRRADLESGLDEADWDKLLHYASLFSADCCKDIFNYVSKDFGEQMKKQ